MYGWLSRVSTKWTANACNWLYTCRRFTCRTVARDTSPPYLVFFLHRIFPTIRQSTACFRPSRHGLNTVHICISGIRRQPRYEKEQAVPLPSRGIVLFCCWRRGRSRITDCRQSSRTTQDHTVRFFLMASDHPSDILMFATFLCPDRQVQPRTSDQQYKGVWRSLVRIWNEEGFSGFMRGNGINCLRIVPYSAVQFTTYEQLKKVRASL
jgi:hypothetical protein